MLLRNKKEQEKKKKNQGEGVIKRSKISGSSENDRLTTGLHRPRNPQAAADEPAEVKPPARCCNEARHVRLAGWTVRNASSDETGNGSPTHDTANAHPVATITHDETRQTATGHQHEPSPLGTGAEEASARTGPDSEEAAPREHRHTHAAEGCARVWLSPVGRGAPGEQRGRCVR
ncbi:hypothetical protein HPB50_025166 [Hyalomma asiaticum]|uniref:Uncharacterized protein n=1 Tax=Hyalomma asiaticum TaxID=266040 RepID=A0ACB7SFQ5_HYAAI|nr:hypothetical protein HPB50_025166 [Hyalomma asiaticum]